VSKTVYLGLSALALWGAAANVYAVSPTVAGEYYLWGAYGYFVADVTTSPNGRAVLLWHTFENEAFTGTVTVMKSAGDRYVAEGTRTAALNGDWSKIAISREIQVFGPPEDNPCANYSDFVDDTEKVARQIGVQPEEVAAATYSDDFRGVGRVSQPFIVDLETGAETPLAVAGGDFLYWLNDDELVIGRETSGHECVGYGSLEAIKYDVRNGEREAFPSEDLPPLLNERCTVGAGDEVSIYYGPYLHPGYLNPLYTSKDWRLLPAACKSELGKPAPPVALPSRGGQFESDEGAIYWVPVAGEKEVKVAAGEALAASDDGGWLFVRSEREFTPRYYTVDGVRVRDDIVTFEGFYVFRLEWQ
jgi:hypothetical protein